MNSHCPNGCARKFSVREKARIFSGSIKECDRCECEIEISIWWDFLPNVAGAAVTTGPLLFALVFGLWPFVILFGLVVFALFSVAAIFAPIRKTDVSIEND